ncbi:hypothetical protein EV122DRAFT_282047 [Schizophyllum commune]
MTTSTAHVAIPTTPPSSSRLMQSRRPPYQPLNSSPLANSAELPSFGHCSERRRSQYKATGPTTPSNSRTPLPPSASGGGSVFLSGGSGSRKLFVNSSPSEDPQKAFLRDRFKAKCLERAAQARRRSINKRRYASSEPSSDGFDLDMDMDDDEDEEDEEIMNDEFFRRVVAFDNCKDKRSFDRWYAREFGTDDPHAMERWAEEEAEAAANAAEEELTPEDLEQAELEAYAEELANQGGWDDPPAEHPSSDADMIHDMDMDVDMDF